MSDKIIIGNHQEIHIGNFKMDRRGFVSGSIQRHRKGESYTSIDGTYFTLSAAPPTGLPCVGVERDYDDKASMAIYTYTYEGLMDGLDPSRVAWERDVIAC